jgi:2,4-dienoyl-CoA reductase-like NADH-dependent reductase (Old Yellow Enzyme family)
VPKSFLLAIKVCFSFLEEEASLTVTFLSLFSSFSPPQINSADFQNGGPSPLAALLYPPPDADLPPLAGLTNEESKQVIKWLDDAGVDLVEASGGVYESGLDDAWQHKSERTRKREAYCASLFSLLLSLSFCRTQLMPSSFPPLAPPSLSMPLSALEQAVVEFAESVKPSIHNAKLCVTGGFRSRAAMEEALQGGATDIVGLARPLTAEPHLIREFVEGKKEKARENKMVRLSLSLSLLLSPLPVTHQR